MVEVPLLWASGARKETMDLLRTVWAHATPKLRDELANAIVAGPPKALLQNVDVKERQESRDRRIFDRLIVVERIGDPPLNSTLQTEARRLHELYPAWRAREGEKAHFSTWMELRHGPETRYGIEELKALDDEALAGILTTDQNMREGMLEAWRQFGNAEPTRAVSILERLAGNEDIPADIVERGLWGLREAAKQPELRDRLIVLLEHLQSKLFEQTDVFSAVSDFLETAAASQPSPTNDKRFWRLFDRTAQAISLGGDDAATADRDWVSHAINRPLGKLATAFFSALFARELKVGARLPDDLHPRLDDLMALGVPTHRPARVIAASRLSYLFAVDPEWTQASLIPSFDWAVDEQEALAVWQGYAWQPQIDRMLWAALKRYFLPTFTAKRLRYLGDYARSIGQLLALVGIEFGLEELPRDGVRNAIRIMPEDMRTEVVSWITSYLEQSEQDTPAENEADSARPTHRDSDSLWTERVKPWLDRVWPPEPALRAPTTAEQFALVAIATDARFPEAVASLAPHIVPSNAYYVCHKLAQSSHPERHPEATLKLVDAIADPSAQRYDKSLEQVLERVRIADPRVAQGTTLRIWIERLQARR